MRGKNQRSIAYRADKDATARIAELEAENRVLRGRLGDLDELDRREALVNERAGKAVMALAVAKQMDEATERAEKAEATVAGLKGELEAAAKANGKMVKALMRYAPAGGRLTWLVHVLDEDGKPVRPVVAGSDEDRERVARLAERLGLDVAQVAGSLGRVI